ncbi:hypothetical protein STANM309S_00390 [Streptomyces tanashiensis]
MKVTLWCDTALAWTVLVSGPASGGVYAVVVAFWSALVTLVGRPSASYAVVVPLSQVTAPPVP